jgi:hypothetical protein
MPKGDSGRVVIEVEPGLKRQLYSALAAEGSTLKAWFIETATTYLRDREQPQLPVDAPKKKLRQRS